MEAFVFCLSTFLFVTILSLFFFLISFSQMSVRGGGNYLPVTFTADLPVTKKRALLWLLGDGSVRDR